jgi:hypothetical protein
MQLPGLDSAVRLQIIRSVAQMRPELLRPDIDDQDATEKLQLEAIKQGAGDVGFRVWGSGLRVGGKVQRVRCFYACERECSAP